MSDEWSNPVRDQFGNIVIIAGPMLPNGSAACIHCGLPEHTHEPPLVERGNVRCCGDGGGSVFEEGSNGMANTARVRAWLDNEHSSFPVPEDDIRTLLTIVEPRQRGDQDAAEKIDKALSHSSEASNDTGGQQ